MEYHWSSLGVLASVSILLLLPFLYLYSRQIPAPSIDYSQVADLTVKGWRSRLCCLPKLLLSFSIGCLALSLPNLEARRVKKEAMQKAPTEGRALYIVLDISGSMIENKRAGLPTKMDVMKYFTEKFIEGDPELGLKGRQNDLIGLVAFARKAELLSPLTLDHASVVERLKNLTAVSSAEENGTAIGYAIYKTAATLVATEHFSKKEGQKPIYSIVSSAIVLVTDGFQSPNSLDKGNWLRTMGIEEAIEYARENRIKIYLINIEPSLKKEEFLPHRNLFTRLAVSTGGNFFLVDSLKELPQIYQEIDAIEKSAHPSFTLTYQSYSALPYLFAISVVLLFTAVGVEMLTRVAP